LCPRRRITEDREAILAALRDGETIASAARRGGTGETTLRDQMVADGDFATQVEAARSDGRRRRADELIGTLYEGAAEAGEDPRFTTQLIFALCNLHPENRRQVAHIHQQVRIEQHVSHDLHGSLNDILRHIAGGRDLPQGDGQERLPASSAPPQLPGRTGE
jgi:hypothetical protein